MFDVFSLVVVYFLFLFLKEIMYFLIGLRIFDGVMYLFIEFIEKVKIMKKSCGVPPP